jgi:hypothetical protein
LCGDDNWELSLAGKRCSRLDNLFDVLSTMFK